MNDASTEQTPPAPPTGDDGTEGTGDQAVTAVTAALETLLVQRGALSSAELAEALEETAPELAATLGGLAPGTDQASRVEALARQGDEFWRLADGRLAAVLYWLRRATFTHRLSASELAREAIDLLPDLVALALPRSFSLADGTAVSTAGAVTEPRAAESGSILGPKGWLSAYAAGDLMAVRYDGDQADIQPFTGLTPDDAAEDTASETASEAVKAALRQVFPSLPQTRAPEVHRLVVETMGTEPTSFATPVAPLVELLTEAGLRVRDAWVGEADTAWATPPEAARRRRLDELLVRADQCCQRSARRSLESWHGWLEALETATAESADPTVAVPVAAAEATEVADAVDHGPVAALLAELATLGRPGIGVRRIGEWAAAVAAGAGRSAAGLCYLEALGADAAGDALTAEARLLAGLALSADHPACLGFLAEFVQDRGDAERSLTLLRQAGRQPSQEALAELKPFLVNRQLGRNEPCSCGSGRKFKTCCARRPAQRPLAERGRWLLSKAFRHAVRADPLSVASLRQLFDESTGGDDAVALAGDMLLFPSGGLARYVATRGPLLPADEAAAAAAWASEPLRLLEIATPTDGAAVTAVDLRTGERLLVAGPFDPATVAPGDAVLTRALPVGNAWLLTAALLRIPPVGRERALALVQGGDVRPFQLLELQIDLQVEAMKASR